MDCYTCESYYGSMCLNPAANVIVDPEYVAEADWPVEYDPAWILFCDGYQRGEGMEENR